MKYELFIVIPEVPLNQNVVLRKHYMARNTYNKHWYKVIKLATMGRAPAKPLDKYRITIVQYSQKEPDGDNLVATMKPVIDGFRHAKIIVDDKYTNGGPQTAFWIKTPKEEQRLELRVEEGDEIRPYNLHGDWVCSKCLRSYTEGEV